VAEDFSMTQPASNWNRRDFIKLTAAGAGTLALAGNTLAQTPANTLTVGVMGVNGRGTALAKGFAAIPNCAVAYVCDVDSRAMDRCALDVSQLAGREPRKVADFRRILDDQSVDALVIAAPDHWHAPATILGCTANKHVYCEKPASHNPAEGEMMVGDNKKKNRVVQLGTQRRSAPKIIEGIEKVRSGAIGRALFAQSWYNNARPSIGHGQEAPVPEWLNYPLWQGPAPARPFRDNLIHYNWHWLWHWGTGELGNNGIHALDVCRWGLGVDYPTRVTSGGGKYRWDDDQETPDTHVVTFDFGGKSISWEGRSWSRRGFEGEMFGCAFYGDAGSLVITGGGYVRYDERDREVERVSGSVPDSLHLVNFLDCIRSNARPNADIEEGHKSTLLCHLGNIAHRTSSVVHFDPERRRIVDNAPAQQLWGREYQPGWEPAV